MSAAATCPTHGEWVDDGTTDGCPECIAETLAGREPTPDLDLVDDSADRLATLDLLRVLEQSGALTRVSLDLEDPDLDYDRWESIGRFLGALRDLTAWALGDWLIFGEAVYGEKYAQAVEATGRSKQTLKNYAWVALNVPKSRRRDTLSWSHHEAVASLSPSDQKRWLDRAEAERWSVEELRGAKQGRLLDATEPDRGSGGPVVIEMIEEAARLIWRVGNPDGHGFILVPVDAWARLAAALGEE